MDDAKNIYITDNNVIISEKEGRAEQLAYNCSNTPDDPATYFHKIQCGSTASDVMQAYGQNNVTVLCSDTIVETRLFDITGKNIRLWLTKNAVQRIKFSTQPFPPSENFEKRWLGRCLCHHQSKRLHLFLHDPRQMRMQFFLQGEGFGEIIPCYGIVFLNTRFFDSQIMGMTQG